MPGVTITTAVRSGPIGSTIRASSQAFFVGLTDRGPTNKAILVTSLAEFESYYGGYQSYSYLHPTVETFFEEGGTQCWISRVVGPSATTGFVTLNDGSTDTVTFTANGPGAWSDDLTVGTAAGVAASTRTVTLYVSGTAVFVAQDTASSEEILSKFASSTVASYYVTVTDEGGGLVDIFAPQSITAGDDDRSNVTSALYVTGLTNFLDSYGSGAVACPESHVQEVYQGLTAHANTNNRVALLHSAAAQTATQAQTLGMTIRTNEPNGEHAGLYWPWILTPTTLSGVNRLIPPDGYVAGCRARSHNNKGSHQPAAGVASVARWVNAIELEVDSSTGNLLDADNVNVIRLIEGTFRIYGARSLSNDPTNFRYLMAQDTVNTIVHAATSSLENLVFSVIDGRGNIFASVQSRLIAILEPLRVSGALYEAYNAKGKRLDMGYTIKCDKALNPASQLATGEVKAKVGVRVSSIGDKITVDIIKSNLTTSVV